MWGNLPCQGWSGGWGMPFHGMLFFLSLLLTVGSLAILVHWLAGRRARRGDELDRPRGLDTLEERYAKGQIERDEYLEKKSDLST